MQWSSTQVDSLPAGVRALPLGLRSAWVGAASAALDSGATAHAAKRSADRVVSLLTKGLSGLGLTVDALEPLLDPASSHPLVVGLRGDDAEALGRKCSGVLGEDPPAEPVDLAAWLAERMEGWGKKPEEDGSLPESGVVATDALSERGASGVSAATAAHADGSTFRCDRFALDLTGEAQDAVARALSRRERLSKRGDAADFDAVISQLRKDGFDDYVTPEGYLKLKVRAARSGTQLYSDGFEIWGEYRPPEEVFSDASLASWAYKPFTDDHPPDFVGVHNWADYAVGVVGNDARRVAGPDGDEYVEVTIVVYGFDALLAIRSGKVELSAGYSATMVRKAGRDAKGREYAFWQTDIFINHLSLVDRGRAGPLARISLDGFAWQVAEQPSHADAVGTQPKHEDTMPNEDKIKVQLADGVEVELTKDAADAYEAHKAKEYKEYIEKAKADAAAEAKHADQQAKLDAAKAENEALSAKVDELTAAKADADAKLLSLEAEVERLQADAASRLRAEVVDTIREVCPKLDLKDEDSIAEIKAAALVDLAPHFKTAIEQYRGHGDKALAQFVDTLFEAEVGRARKSGKSDAAPTPATNHAPRKVVDLNSLRAQSIGKAG